MQIKTRLDRALSKADAIRKELEARPEKRLALPKDFVEFNQIVGLPLHPLTNREHHLLPYQIEIGECLYGNTIINKSNKIGVTEAVLRKYAYRGAIGDCQGYEMMLGAQDRTLAMENMKRLASLFERSAALRKYVLKSTATRLYLKNETKYFVMPRNSNAMRGWPRLKAAFLDEASHYGFLDDESILTAVSGRLANTNGYLDIVSTPHGQRGFFHRLFILAEANKIPFKAFKIPYTSALGILISQEKIDQDRKTMTPEAFCQEYECKFISSENAAIESYLVDSAIGDYTLD